MIRCQTEKEPKEEEGNPLGPVEDKALLSILVSKAKEEFVTTSEPENAFFLLPDGTFLEPPENAKHHSIIEQHCMLEAVVAKGFPPMQLRDFLKIGFIRVCGIPGGRSVCEIWRLPTSAQRVQLGKLFRLVAGEICVDVQRIWGNSYQVGASPSRIISDIFAVFNGQQDPPPNPSKLTYSKWYGEDLMRVQAEADARRKQGLNRGGSGNTGCVKK